jgi:hypothetical protein
MRISFNDRLHQVKRPNVTTLDTEGNRASTYTTIYTALPGDLQPIGSKVDLAQYGINYNPADVRKLFVDFVTNIRIGDVVTDDASKQYMVKGLRVWYSHIEAILEPWSGQ